MIYFTFETIKNLELFTHLDFTNFSNYNIFMTELTFNVIYYLFILVLLHLFYKVILWFNKLVF